MLYNRTSVLHKIKGENFYMTVFIDASLLLHVSTKLEKAEISNDLGIEDKLSKKDIYTSQEIAGLIESGEIEATLVLKHTSGKKVVTYVGGVETVEMEVE